MARAPDVVRTRPAASPSLQFCSQRLYGPVAICPAIVRLSLCGALCGLGVGKGGSALLLQYRHDAAPFEIIARSNGGDGAAQSLWRGVCPLFALLSVVVA